MVGGGWYNGFDIILLRFSPGSFPPTPCCRAALLDIYVHLFLYLYRISDMYIDVSVYWLNSVDSVAAGITTPPKPHFFPRHSWDAAVRVWLEILISTAFAPLDVPR